MKEPVALIVSSPNDGGVFAIYNENVYKLSSSSATGLCITETHIVLCEQPDTLRVQGLNDAMPVVSLDNIYDVHDVIVHNGAIYLAGTYDNEIIQVSLDGGIVLQRWPFPGEHDSLHINCLAVWNEDIYFCAFGDFFEERGYKGNSAGEGFIQNLFTQSRPITGLSQPHSIIFTPRGTVILANSEKKEIIEFDLDGRELRRKELGGYTRGICYRGDHLYVGLSCSRNIEESGVSSATVVRLDAASWSEQFKLKLPVREIFSISVIEDEAHFFRVILAFANRNMAFGKEMDEGVKDVLVAASQTIFPKLLKDTEKLRCEIINLETQINGLAQKLEALEALHVDVEHKNIQLEVELEQQQKSAVSLQAICAQKEQELGAIYSSRIWHIAQKVTAIWSFVLKVKEIKVFK